MKGESKRRNNEIYREIERGRSGRKRGKRNGRRKREQKERDSGMARETKIPLEK